MHEEGSTGGRSGTARPFPLWHLRSSPCATPIHRKYSGAVFRSCPPGPNTRTLNCQPLGWFRLHWLSVSLMHVARQCGAPVTYRPVSYLSASTICRCTTAIGRTIGEQELPVPHCGADFMIHCRCFTDSGALS